MVKLKNDLYKISTYFKIEISLFAPQTKFKKLFWISIIEVFLDYAVCLEELFLFLSRKLFENFYWLYSVTTIPRRDSYVNNFEQELLQVYTIR